MKTKQLILVINGKGGVGKSFFAVNFVQYLKDYSVEHWAIDTDNENSTLKRFHSEADFIDLQDAQEMDRIFLALEQHDLVVVDCRAASTDVFLDYFGEIDLFSVLNELNTGLTVVSPINHEADSLEQLRVITDTLQGNAQYVVVKNESHSTKFRLYDDSKIRQKILDEFDGVELILPRMQDWLVTSLNESNVTASAATNGRLLSLVDRQRLKNWLKHFEMRQLCLSVFHSILLFWSIKMHWCYGF